MHLSFLKNRRENVTKNYKSQIDRFIESWLLVKIIIIYWNVNCVQKQFLKNQLTPLVEPEVDCCQIAPTEQWFKATVFTLFWEIRLFMAYL